MILEAQEIVLSPGLADQDQHIDTLLTLWEDLQRSALDSSQAPMPNLFSFVESALFFAVILQKKEVRVNEKGLWT
jgi:hypothetical protein